jgi:hypothetical protein
MANVPCERMAHEAAVELLNNTWIVCDCEPRPMIPNLVWAEVSQTKRWTKSIIRLSKLYRWNILGKLN